MWLLDQEIAFSVGRELLPKHPRIDDKGYVLYYTNQCPFNGKYVPILEQVASDNSIPFKAIKIESKEQAQSVPSPCTFQSKNETIKFHLDLSCKRYDLFLVNGFCAAYQSA